MLKEDNAFVSTVDGQAEALGIRTGDVIVRVDGTKVSKEMVSHLLKTLGRPLKLTIRRKMAAASTAGEQGQQQLQLPPPPKPAIVAAVEGGSGESEGTAKPALPRSGSRSGLGTNGMVRMGSYQM